MDLLRAWASMGAISKICFLFVFVASALALIRALRVAVWTVRPAAGDAAGARVRTVGRWARSTRGQAQAAVWLMAAAGAAGLVAAYSYLGNSSRPGIFHIIDDSVRVIDAAAVGLGLCAALFAMALVFDVAVCRIAGWRAEVVAAAFGEPRRARVVTAVRFARRGLGIAGLLALAFALAAFRTNLEAEVGPHGDSRLASAAFQALGLLWGRVAQIAASLGLLTWLAVVVENRDWHARREPVR